MIQAQTHGKAAAKENTRLSGYSLPLVSSSEQPAETLSPPRQRRRRRDAARGGRCAGKKVNMSGTAPPCPVTVGRQAGPAARSGTATQPTGRPGQAIQPRGGWRSPCARCTRGRWTLAWELPARGEGGRPGWARGHRDLRCHGGRAPGTGWRTDPPPSLSRCQPGARWMDRRTDGRGGTPAGPVPVPRPPSGHHGWRGSAPLRHSLGPGRLLAGELVLRLQSTAPGL